MPSLRTLVAAALAGSASFVDAAPTKEKRERNDLTPKVIMDNVRIHSMRVCIISETHYIAFRIGALQVSFLT